MFLRRHVTARRFVMKSEDEATSTCAEELSAA